MNPIEPEREPDEEPPKAVEGEYLAPDQHPASGRNWRAAGGTAVGFAVLAAKFKGVIFALLNLKWLLLAPKFALSGIGFLASIWFYSLFFGWKFAVMFVLMILLHEAGHAVFVRGYGLSVPGIYFVPGLGAFTSFTGTYTPYEEALIGFGGPLFGTIGASVAFAYGILTNEPFWLALANVTFLINLFNMAPLGILDGAKITGAISPKLWIGGFILTAVAVVVFRLWTNPIIILLVLFAIPRTWQAYRGQLDARYATVTGKEKATIAGAYFGLLIVMIAGLVFSTTSIPGHPYAG